MRGWIGHLPFAAFSFNKREFVNVGWKGLEAQNHCVVQGVIAVLWTICYLLTANEAISFAPRYKVGAVWTLEIPTYTLKRSACLQMDFSILRPSEDIDHRDWHIVLGHLVNRLGGAGQEARENGNK